MKAYVQGYVTDNLTGVIYVLVTYFTGTTLTEAVSLPIDISESQSSGLVSAGNTAILDHAVLQSYSLTGSDIISFQEAAQLPVVATGSKGVVPAPTAGDASKYLKGDGTWATIAGGGDVVGPTVAVSDQIATFDGTTGKLIKAATTTGILKSTSGVIGAAVGDTDYALPATVALKAPLDSPAFTGTPTGITKSHVGLGNVDNTSDLNKPVLAKQSKQLKFPHLHSHL